MVAWPAVIKYAEEDELVYISDAAMWNGDGDFHFAEYDVLDILIDSAGFIHHFVYRDDGIVFFEPTNNVVDLTSAIDIVKVHFASIGACCSAKLTARSMGELIELVGRE